MDFSIGSLMFDELNLNILRLHAVLKRTGRVYRFQLETVGRLHVGETSDQARLNPAGDHELSLCGFSIADQLQIHS